MAPSIFDLLMEIFQNCLSVITHMFPDPPAGSGPAGQAHPARLDPTLKKAKLSLFSAGPYLGVPE